MVKIKTIKKLNLPQLMEWAWENDVRDKNLLADNNTTPLRINIGGDFIFDNDYIYSKNHTFTIEIEEEITEDTVIPKMLVIGRFDGYEEVYNRKISHFNQHLLSAYLIDDDGHMELLYDEEKGLVE